MRTPLVIGILIVIGVILSLIFTPQNPICPEDFKDKERGGISTIEWIDKFYRDNPDASEEDFYTARINFLIENDCDKTLDRY